MTVARPKAPAAEVVGGGAGASLLTSAPEVIGVGGARRRRRKVVVGSVGRLGVALWTWWSVAARGDPRPGGGARDPWLAAVRGIQGRRRRDGIQGRRRHVGIERGSRWVVRERIVGQGGGGLFFLSGRTGSGTSRRVPIGGAVIIP